MNLYPDITLNLLYAFALLLTTYAVGHIALSFFDRRGAGTAEIVFYKLAVGMALLVASVAVAFTGFRTLQGAFFMLLIFTFVYLWKKGSAGARFFRGNISQVDLLPLAFTGALLVAAYLLQYLTIADFSGNLYEIHPDKSYYAAMAVAMPRTGVESFTQDWVNVAGSKSILYHYFEIWYSVIPTLFFPVSAMYSQVLVSNAVMGAAVCAGCAAIVQKYSGGGIVKAYAAGSLILFMGLVFLIPSVREGNFNFRLADFRHVSVEKLYSLFIGYISCVLLARCKDRVLKYLPLAAMIISYTTISYTIIGGVALALLPALFFSRTGKENKLQAWIAAGIIVAVVVYMVLVYDVFNLFRENFINDGTIPGDSGGNYSTFRLLTMFLSQNGLGDMWLRCARILLEIVLFTLPCFLPLFFLSRVERGEILRLVRSNLHLVMIAAVAVALSSITYFLTDSFQIYSNTLYPLMFILNFTTVSLFLFRQGSGVWLRIYAGVVIAFNIYLVSNMQRSPQIDARFYSAVERVIENEGGKGNFAVVRSGESLRNSTLFDRNPRYCNIFADIRRFSDNYLPVYLEALSIPYDDEYIVDLTFIKPSIYNSVFVRWVRERGMGGDIREAQNTFIRENDIRYIIVEKGYDWLSGRPFVVEQVISSPAYGYDFIKIRPENPN